MSEIVRPKISGDPVDVQRYDSDGSAWAEGETQEQLLLLLSSDLFHFFYSETALSNDICSVHEAY